MIAPDRLYDLALVIAFAAVALAQILAMIRLVIGPTTGDRVRLADTELWIEVEKDFRLMGRLLALQSHSAVFPKGKREKQG